MTGLVAFLVTFLSSSSAEAATSTAAPLCDFRGASIVVQVPEATASFNVDPGESADKASDKADKGSSVAALCDLRGATMIAPAPQLQSETTWLTLTPGPNMADALNALHSVTPGQEPLVFEMQLPDPSLISAVPSVAPASEVGRVACPVAENRTHDGVKSSLERPPRV